jgi:hypothetical protein
MQEGAGSRMAQTPGSFEDGLMSGRTGLTLWNGPEATSRATPAAPGGTRLAPAPSGPQAKWTLGGDLEKYRAHAVTDGSRNSGENLKKALERAGQTVSDGVSVFVLGYGSDRAKPFRANDGKGLFQEPGRVPARAGATIVSLGDGLYSIVDLATFNALPDPNKSAYRDNNPLVRPLVFTGQTIGGVWKTTEEVGNAVTWGLFDNFTGCVGLVIEDIVEFVKHTGQAVTNVARAPIHLVAGKNKEAADRAMDWILLVPLEYASNVVEMKGIANMHDYQTAFADKGVIGSVLEFGGSTYLVYRAVDKAVDKHKKNKNKNNQNETQPEQPSEPETPETPETPEPPQPPEPPVPDVPDVEPPTGPQTIWYFDENGVLRSFVQE